MTDRMAEDIVSAAGRMAKIAQALTAGALANLYVREFIDNPDPDWPGGWTDEKVRANPIVRVEFDHATVVGTIGESLAAAQLRGKGGKSRWKPSFGELVGVLPLEAETPVGEKNVVYLYKGTSPYNRRVEQRRYLKKRLGPGHRSQVGYAMTWGKGEFIKNLPTESARRIQARLNLDPGRFWRVVRGKEFVEQVTPQTTPEMFDIGERVKKARAKRVKKSLPLIQTPSLFPTDPQETP